MAADCRSRRRDADATEPPEPGSAPRHKPTYCYSDGDRAAGDEGFTGGSNTYDSVTDGWYAWNGTDECG